MKSEGEAMPYCPHCGSPSPGHNRGCPTYVPSAPDAVRTAAQKAVKLFKTANNDGLYDAMKDLEAALRAAPGPDALPLAAGTREALEPFANIALFVEYTDARDGEVVHRQYDRDGKRVELTKEDFRRAARVYASLTRPMLDTPPAEPK